MYYHHPAFNIKIRKTIYEKRNTLLYSIKPCYYGKAFLSQTELPNISYQTRLHEAVKIKGKVPATLRRYHYLFTQIISTLSLTLRIVRFQV